MKKGLLKRCICAISAAAMLVSFTACGKASVPMASKENVFRATEIPIPSKFDYIQTMASNGTNIYLIGEKGETQGEGENQTYSSKTMMLVMDTAGNELNTTVIYDSKENEEGSWRNINKIKVNNDGSMDMLVNVSSWNEETYESKNDFFIEKYDTNGKPSGSFQLKINNSSDDYVYFSSFVKDDNGVYYLLGNNIIYMYDSNGKMLGEIKGEENKGTDSGTYMNCINKTGDGRILVIENSFSMEGDTYISKNTAKVLDAASGKFTDEYSVNSNYSSFYDGGGDFDLYFSKDNALCGLDIETGTETVILDWLKSGLDTTTMENATILPDGRVLCTTYKYEASGGGYSWSNSDMVISILERVDPSEIPDKQLVTVYAWYLDYRVKQRIVEFNKNNDLYQIEVTCYSDYDDGTGNYDAWLTKFNNDLTSGNIPDIILLDASMPVDSYIAKGLLSDLYKFMDKDEEINKENYLPNVLEAFSQNGKLYSITPSFSIQTVVGAASDVGTENGWTMADYIALAEKNPDKQLFAEMTRDSFLYNQLSYCIGSYVDKSTGKCSFNSDGFKQLLEVANTYPKEINWDELYADDNYWMDREKQFRDKKVLLNTDYINNFESIRENEQGRFGEPITYVGYPCENKNGSVIMPDNEFAITAKAKNPDGAWEFVKYFLTEEYQNSVSGLPIMESAYAGLMEKAKEKPFYMDENDVKQEYDRTYWLGDQEIKIGVNTDEDNEKLMNFIKSVNSKQSYDKELVKIITEEAEAYFSGQKSVDEVADIIQNRASTYISESR